MHPSRNTSRTGRFRRLLGGVAIVGTLAAAGAIATGHYLHPAQATATAAAAEQAVPVTVAMIEPRQTALWDDFSGRLEPHQPRRAPPARCRCDPCDEVYRGALVKAGDVLITIDPAPYAAEVDTCQGAVEAARRAWC